ncbi:MAG: hypothetical protein U0930_16705 [Pirellulales bacterium]
MTDTTGSKFTMEIDLALIATLGGDQLPVVDPIGITDRIKQLPIDLRAVVQAIIDRTMEIPLPEASSLQEISDKIRESIDSQMPELSDLVRAKLANYYTYQWR